MPQEKNNLETDKPDQLDVAAEPAPAGSLLQGMNDLLCLGSGRLAGAVALVLCVAVILGLSGGHWAQTLLFDAYQKVWPRERQSFPVVIVEIDEASLRSEGQWPWPRTRIADLVDAIALASPAAIGLDILFPEPDRMSPGRLVNSLPQLTLEQQKALAALPDNDSFLADALALSPSVLAAGGLADSAMGNRLTHQLGMTGEGNPVAGLTNFKDFVLSLPVLTESASGQGFVNAVHEPDGVHRRPLLIATHDDSLVLSFTMELLRVATGGAPAHLTLQQGKPHMMDIAGINIPLEPDGGYRLHYAPSIDDIYVSAQDVLAGRVPAEDLAGRIVLIGMTGLGLQDYHSLPTGALVPGVEIHAQMLESALDQAQLSRPAVSFVLEALLALVTGLVLLVITRRVSAQYMMVMGFGLAVIILLIGPALFSQAGLVFDSLSPAIATIITGIILSGALSAIAVRDKKLLQAEVERRREESARLKGELEAARKIQLGLLPSAEQVAFGEHRIDLAAFLEPAREVGGDLYDLFFIDKDHLFFMVGDVSGKGVPASLFMAISKSIYKNAVLRRRADIGDIMTEANAEISRDNPELLFITVFAGVLDLRDGSLEYCNAGHDNPLILSAQGALIDRLEDAGGPPLCVLDDWEYESATTRLDVTQSLLVTTDGITEAMDHDGALYGQDRMEATIARNMAGGRAVQVVNELLDDVKVHCKGAPPSDDTTVMFLRYLGQAAETDQPAPINA